MLSHVQLFVTPRISAHQASLSFIISQSLLKCMSTESMIPSIYLILCHPLLLLPSIFPIIRVFANELALLIKWPKYWSFNFTISSSNEYSGLIFLKIDLFGLFAVQETLKSLLQDHRSRVSILWCSAFFMVQISHQYLLKKQILLDKPGAQSFPGGSEGKVSAYNAEDPGSIPGSGRSPGEGNGNPL